MPVSRRQALGLAGGAAGLHLLPTGPMASRARPGRAAEPVRRHRERHGLRAPGARAHDPERLGVHQRRGGRRVLTLRWNREAWDRIRLRTRVLVDVSKLDTRTRHLRAGTRLPHPARPHRVPQARSSGGRSGDRARRGSGRRHHGGEFVREHRHRRHREGGEGAALVPALRPAGSRLHEVDGATGGGRGLSRDLHHRRHALWPERAIARNGRGSPCPRVSICLTSRD